MLTIWLDPSFLAMQTIWLDTSFLANLRSNFDTMNIGCQEGISTTCGGFTVSGVIAIFHLFLVISKILITEQGIQIAWTLQTFYNLILILIEFGAMFLLHTIYCLLSQHFYETIDGKDVITIKETTGLSGSSYGGGGYLNMLLTQ